jgi:uncharacterized protein (DUF1778 family)
VELKKAGFKVINSKICNILMSLTARDTGAFVKALLKPPAPSKKLKRAAERYNEIMGNK